MNSELHIRFWMGELPIRIRRWWHRHWWPSRIEQLDRERRYWKDAALKAEAPDGQ